MAGADPKTRGLRQRRNSVQPQVMGCEVDGYRRFIERDTPGCCAIQKTISIMVFGICLLEAGCAARTVWKAEVRSPDGIWIATARTVQSGGFGTAWITTSVSLKRVGSSDPPMEVLGFSCQGPVPRPYVLDNVANAGRTMNLRLKWVSATHLEVTYSGKPDIYLQVVKYQGVEITLRDLSGRAGAGPEN